LFDQAAGNFSERECRGWRGVKSGSTFWAVFGFVGLKRFTETIIAKGVATRGSIRFIEGTIAYFTGDELSNGLEFGLKEIEKLGAC
jgi:hypothetical protein